MNIELINKIIAVLEAGPQPGVPNFQMEHFMRHEAFGMRPVTRYSFQTRIGEAAQQNWCGTTCCIAGYAVFLDDAARKDLSDGLIPYDEIEIIARALLELDATTANSLFYARDARSGFYCTTDAVSNNRKWAAACLRNLLATGRVDWMATKPKELED